MKRTSTYFVCGLLLLGCGVQLSTAWGRGFGGGGGGGARMGGGGGGGGRAAGGFGGGGGVSRPSSGFSGGGFQAPQIQRPQAPAISRPSGNFGGGGNVQRPSLGGGGSGLQRPDFGGGAGSRPGLVHMPGSGNGGLQIGDRPQIGEGGAITRPDFANRPGSSGGGIQNRLPNTGAGNAGNRLPNAGDGGAGNRFGAGGTGTATLPGLAPRPGAGGAGERNPGLAGGAGSRLPNAGQNAGSRFTPESRPARQQNIGNQFDQLQNNWGDGDWHSWTGPNGGQINHIGFWGPNGYWGHTGAWGPNGGHVGHSTGIGQGGAYSRTSGWGPNGNAFSRGAAVGPNGAAAWARGAGPAGYWSRSWGGWYNGYGPAWGYGRWDYLWNQYPVAMAFGCTMWGLNAVSYAMGIDTYSNPYYDDGSYPVDYSQPLTGDPSYETAAAEDVDPATDPLTQLFDQARAAFQQNQFDQALQLTDQALQQAPRDAALNEFRSLCLFALGRYRESAAVIHSVLAAGPGWDWTTMVGLYSSVDVYTQQLRQLEAAAQADPKSADTRFLLGYHYLTADHPDQAVAMWQQVVALQPADKLASDLVQMYGPKEDVPPTQTAATSPGDLDKPAYPMDKLMGDWKAMTADGSFELKLDQDSFTWSFTRDGMAQSVSGAYDVRGNNLVMQPDSGGTLPAVIALENDNTLSFTPAGDAQKLTFTK